MFDFSEANSLRIYTQRLLIAAAGLSPALRNRYIFRAYRDVSGCLLGTRELVKLSKYFVKAKHSLVFGVGGDAAMWFNLSRRVGASIMFLEDDAQWIKRCKESSKALPVAKVEYSTRKKDWELYSAGSARPPELQIPGPYKDDYDFIFVDGPRSYSDECPGRMQSLYMASKLIADNGIVAVDDYDRYIERTLVRAYLTDYKITDSVNDKLVFLRKET